MSTGLRNSRKPERKLPLLTVSERERLRSQVAEDRGYLESLHSAPKTFDALQAEAFLPPVEASRSVEAASIQARLKRTERAIERMDPANQRLSGRDRQAACREMKEHEEWLRKRMLSTYDMGAYPSSSDHGKQQNFSRAVNKSFAQEVGSREFRDRARRYKELARRLEPDDPELSNIERFRARRRY